MTKCSCDIVKKFITLGNNSECVFTVAAAPLCARVITTRRWLSTPVSQLGIIMEMSHANRVYIVGHYITVRVSVCWGGGAHAPNL